MRRLHLSVSWHHWEPLLTTACKILSTVWPTESQIRTVWSFTEKVQGPLDYNIPLLFFLAISLLEKPNLCCLPFEVWLSAPSWCHLPCTPSLVFPGNFSLGVVARCARSPGSPLCPELVKSAVMQSWAGVLV